MQQYEVNGYIYEADPAGGFRLVGPAQGAAPVPAQGVTINRGRDPSRALQDTRTQQEISENAATLPYAAEKARAEADKAKADAAKAQAELSGKKEAISPEQKAMIDGLGIDNMLAAIQNAREAVGTGRATGVTGALARIIPGTTANDLDAALDTLKGNVMLDKLMELKQGSSTGASGLGALSESEGRMLASVIASLSNRQSDGALLESLSRIEGHALKLKAIRDGADPREPEVQKQYGIAADDRDNAALAGAGGMGGGASAAGGQGAGPSAPPPTPPGGDRMQFAQGQFRDEPDPARVGVNARVRSMLEQYRPPAEIVAYLNEVSPGLGDSQAASIAAAAQFRARNPQVPISDYPVSLEMRRVPMSPAQQMLNEAGQSAPGAAVIGAADALTLGTLDNMTANPAVSRAAMSGAQQMNPGSFLAGQVGGQALLGFGVEGGLGRIGANALTRNIGADALPGLAYGAGAADEGDRAAGALGGGMAGVLGGAIGRGAGRALAGVQDANVSYLADRNVRMTPGQLVGGMAKRIEDAAISVPGLGDMIRGQRRRGIEDFNRAAFGEALAPIGVEASGQVGEEGVKQAQDAVGEAYRNALGGVRVDLNDPQFISDANAAVAQGRSLPNLGPAFDTLAQTRFGSLVGPAGDVSGEGIQDILQGLRHGRNAPNVLNDPLGPEFGAATRDLEGALTGAVSRQAPQVMPAFNAANDAYGRLATIENATNRAVNSGGVFMPSQLGMAARDGAKAFYGRGAAARGDRAFFDLQRAGQEVLPSQLPDSGTPMRMAVMGGALPLGLGVAGGGASYASGDSAADGAGTGLMLGAGLAGALASPYAARGAIQNLMTRRRPVLVERIGEFVGESRLPGAIAIPLLAGPE